ncbi:uncharacterized protein LOC143234783 isoform X2 [Tachypleus tridentatus]|uniref:uncharacterized protein LOC143234783 isoform X2 n=1 Tax=Tachypleus tridentatus TaxID=6853 RepID=UPI003FD6A500
MATHEKTLERDFGHLNTINYTPQQYSATRGKKVAPVVPPKPKKKPVIPEPICNNFQQNSYPLETRECTLTKYPDVQEKSCELIQKSKFSETQEKSCASSGDIKYSCFSEKSCPTMILSTQDVEYPGVNQDLTVQDVSIQENCEKPQIPFINTVSIIQQNSTPQNGGTVLSSDNLIPFEEDLPPPPPPLETSAYSPTSTHAFPPPPAEEKHHLPPLTSSTYVTQSAYVGFRPQSSASTYDTGSIYEPVNPRPVSQMSSRSGSSLYSTYYSGGARGKLIPGMMTRPLGQGPSIGQEAEVDHLTDLLVQSMENSRDPEFFGMCYKCGEKVLGEGSGCTAMGQVYHIKCFTCHVCDKELQGKSFYAMDGKPYCEEDCLNSLEKCCVCGNPVLDRILRATGKPYHPACFKCVVCGKCLDGIPFTVDATSQIHCIDDFHKKFAPRCCVCKQPIMPEPGEQETVRVVALDRSFHISCYRIVDCCCPRKLKVVVVILLMIIFYAGPAMRNVFKP